MERVHLFSEYELRAVLELQERKAQEAVERAPAGELRGRPATAIAQAFVEDFAVAPITLLEGALSVASAEAAIDPMYSGRRIALDPWGPRTVSGFRVTYYLPYAGNSNLLRCRPSTSSSRTPFAIPTEKDIRFQFDVMPNDVADTKRTVEQEIILTRQWTTWVNDDVTRFNSQLPSIVGAALGARLERLRTADEGLAALGLPAHQDAPPPPSVATFSPPPPGALAASTTYDVALSFAGEDREYVEAVATALMSRGLNVFYDKFETVSLWGKNLVDHLEMVYRNGSRFVVMFVSAHYVAKAWPTHERRSAQARALIAKEEYILPARFDEVDVPGMPSTTGFVDLRAISPDEFATLVVQKVAR